MPYRLCGPPFHRDLEETRIHPNTAIIKCLRKHGQLLDREISEETGIPHSTVRFPLSDLSRQGEVSRCSVARYANGKPVKGSPCRIAGYASTFSMNRRSAANRKRWSGRRIAHPSDRGQPRLSLPRARHPAGHVEKSLSLPTLKSLRSRSQPGSVPKTRYCMHA